MLQRLLCDITINFLCFQYRSDYKRYMDIADIEKEQQLKLFDILKRNQNSEYGKKHNFQKIKNMREYQNKVTLTNYEDYLGPIEKIKNGENNILTSDEDESVFEKTVEMVIKTKIDLPRYAILTPFPRTQLYSHLEEENRIVERNWAMYDVEHCVFIPEKMGKEQLERGIEWTWRETYKISSIVKRLASFTNIPWISLPVNWGYREYADKFSLFTREVMTDNSDIPKVNGGKHENNIYSAGNR